MFIDFSGAELSDEQKEVLALPGVQELIKTTFTDREDNTVKLWKEQLDAEKAKTKEFRENNIALKQSEEKIKQQLEEAKTGDDSKAVERLTIELANEKAKREESEGKYEEAKTLLAERDKRINNGIIERQVNAAIVEHNKKYPALPVVEDQGARDFIFQKALKVFKPNEDGKSVTAYESDGSPIGNMGPADWLNGVFRENNSFCFKQTPGGGASGDTDDTSGAGKNMSRIEFDAISDPAKKSEVAKTHTITD